MHRSGTILGVTFYVVLTQSEIDQIYDGAGLLIHKDIVRLDVIVNDSDAVQVLESLVKLHGYHDHRLLREKTASTVLGHQLMQILPKCLKINLSVRKWRSNGCLTFTC